MEDLREELRVERGVVKLSEEEWLEAIKSLRPMDFLRLWPWSCLHQGETFVEMCRRVEGISAEQDRQKHENFSEAQRRRHASK